MVDVEGLATEAVEFIEATLENFDCQPVLFVGAGLARRYIDAPDWDGALKYCLDQLPSGAPDYPYLVQKYQDDKVLIGSHIGDLIFEWAWTEGREKFRPELFESKDRYIFLKTILAHHLTEITPQTLDVSDNTIAREISALKQILPHAIITTNYDSTLEQIFEGYEPIVGSGVLKYNLNSFGEIFHIHGSVATPESIVISEPDYENWSEVSRYFASKLLTYFVEHPVFIFGYGLGDPNVQTVLRDIGRIVADENGLIGNVIQVVWLRDPDKKPSLSEYVIANGDRQYRLPVLNVASLAEVFEALTAKHELKAVNPAMVRALAARVMKLVRRDIPSGEIEVDYSTLERLAKNEDELPKMLGLTIVDNANKMHPYTLSMVAENVGLKSWQEADKLLKRLKDEGYDLREQDNRYHCKIKTGKKETSVTRKWSQDAVDLLQAMTEEKPYKIEL